MLRWLGLAGLLFTSCRSSRWTQPPTLEVVQAEVERARSILASDDSGKMVVQAFSFAPKGKSIAFESGVLEIRWPIDSDPELRKLRAQIDRIAGILKAVKSLGVRSFSCNPSEYFEFAQGHLSIPLVDVTPTPSQGSSGQVPLRVGQAGPH